MGNGHGGKRKGAGRRPLDERETKEIVRAASEEVDLLQPLAIKTLEKALKATTRIQVIKGRDENGKPILESIEVPDHHIRVRAAQIIAAKRIPDVARQEVTGLGGEKVDLGIVYYPVKKKLGEP